MLQRYLHSEMPPASAYSAILDGHLAKIHVVAPESHSNLQDSRYGKSRHSQSQICKWQAALAITPRLTPQIRVPEHRWCRKREQADTNVAGLDQRGADSGNNSEAALELSADLDDCTRTLIMVDQSYYCSLWECEARYRRLRIIDSLCIPCVRPSGRVSGFT
jgi:hypothetical protein